MPTLLLERNVMPRRTTAVPSGPFGVWFAGYLDARGMNQSDAAAKTGTGQSTISSYITGVRKPRSREAAVEFVRALLPRDVEEVDAVRTINEALDALGFARIGGTDDDDDFQVIAKNYSGLPASGRRMLREQSEALARLVREAQGQDTTHGRKVE